MILWKEKLKHPSTVLFFGLFLEQRWSCSSLVGVHQSQTTGLEKRILQRGKCVS